MLGLSRQRLYRVGLWGLLLGGLGCSDSSVVGGHVNPTNSCRSDRDCAEGVCNLEQMRCVVAARAEVFFSVTPAATGLRADAFPTLTAPQTIRSGDEVDLALSTARTVYGAITLSSDATTPDGGEARAYVPAAVEFVPSGLGDVVRPTRAVAADTAVQNSQNDNRPFTFQALLPDGAFDIVVRPVSELAGRLPPLFQQAYDLRTNASAQRFDIAYPARFARWSGVVRDRQGNALQGLVVRAVDLNRDARVVSTVVTTAASSSDPDAPVGGSFNLDFAPGAPEEWVLRITAETSASSWLTIDIPRAALSRNDPTGRNLRIELPSDLGLPYLNGMRPSGGTVPMGTSVPACVGCVDVRASVEGRSSNGATQVLREAQVVMRTTLDAPSLGDGARASFECRTTTDAEGAFRGWLVPGDYDVIVAPNGGEFGNTVRRAFRVLGDVPQQLGQVFTAETRLSVEGRVLTPSRMAVASARVTAIPFHRAYVQHPCFNEPDMALLAPRASVRDAVSARDGAYRLDLDPGLYRFLVEPANGSGFPATLGPAVCVTGRVRALDVALDTPLEIHGVVRDSSQRVAPGATVEAIVRVREPGAQGAVVRVARVSADAQGAYRVLLPSGVRVSD